MPINQLAERSNTEARVLARARQEAAEAKLRAAKAAEAAAQSAEPDIQPEPRPASLAAEIGQALTEAKGAVARLEKAYTEHALAAVMAPAGSEAASAVGGIQDRLNQAKDRVRLLEAAYRQALMADQMADHGRFVALRERQMVAMEHHFAARDQAAAELRAALEAAAAAWRKLIDRSAKAARACPVALGLPSGSMTDFSILHRYVAQEIFRTGGDGSIGNRLSFPGGHPVSFSDVGRPDAIRPIDETLRDASAHTLAELRGRIAE